MNNFTKHYGEHNISPVKQNIKNINAHFYKRKMLYQTLGIPEKLIRQSTVLEVGPGGGYNSIFVANLKPKFYHLAEPNLVGYKELCDLFKTNNFYKNINIENIYVEDLKSNIKFDLVLCEGLLAGLGKESYEVLDILDAHTKNDGILVVTATDEISYFYEQARRLISNILFMRNKITNFEEKKAILIELFSSHLETFGTTTRNVEDWCLDNMMGNACLEASLSIADIINYYKDRYFFYSSSPDIIIDETWYKKVEMGIEDFNESKLNSFYDTWHNLFHYKVFNHNPWERRDIFLLKKYCVEFRISLGETEKNYDKDLQNNIINNIKSILILFKKYNSSSLILDSLQELIDFLVKDKINSHSVVNDFNSFKSAFGRGQQYISLIKKPKNNL